MTSRRPALLRVLLPTLLVVILSGQSMAAAPAVVVVPLAERSVPTQAMAPDRLASSGDGSYAQAPRRTTDERGTAPAAVQPTGETPAITRPTVTRRAPAVPTPKAKSVSAAPVRAAVATRTASTRSSAPSTSSSPSYRGRNRVWIPALGINRSVSWFACTSSAYPGNYVYRWGCAGANNVYLFGHAASVFKPLHDAYVRGSLRKGMKLYYADNAGNVRAYKVAWWKVVTPDNGEFAYAALSSPSVTLQTCVGADNKYRLVVRLVLA